MSRTYSKELKCGCLIAEMDIDGWDGVLPCYAEYGDMSKPEDKKAFRLCKKCWKEYNKKKKE